MHAVKYLRNPPGVEPQRESVHDNIFWRGAAPKMSVCVSACGRDVSPLLANLTASEDAALVEFVIYDDGRCGHDVLAQMQAAAGRLPAAVRIVSSTARHNEMAARGAAAAHARTSWVLLLDGAAKTDAGLIAAYLETISTADRGRCAPLQARAG